MTTLPTHDVGGQPFTPPGLDDLAAAVLGKLLAGLLWLLSCTWKVDARGLQRAESLTRRGTPVVAAFWHGGYLPLFVLARGRQVVVFTSRSFRGKVIAGISRSFGYRPYLVPPGYAGFRAMLDALRRQAAVPLVAVAIDGPLGPFHVAKPGAFRIAWEIAGAVVPVSVRCRPAWTIKRRWDAFVIPLPFATVGIRIGEPVHMVSDDVRSRDALQIVADKVARQLDETW